MYNKMLLKAILLLFTFNLVLANDKVKIDVFYESLCPDSLRFITEQLYPAWGDIAPYVDLNLIPFGKSSSIKGGAEFICQHGLQECKGNRIQSCALNGLKNQDHQVQFVNCFMKTYPSIRHAELGQTCSQLIGLDFEIITNCYKTSLGTELQLTAEKETLKVLPKFVPTITYNGVFDQQLQDASLVNFRLVVCEIIKKTNPEGC